MPLFSALRRQKQTNLEFKISLVYKASFGATVRAVTGKPYLETNKQKAPSSRPQNRCQ